VTQLDGLNELTAPVPAAWFLVRNGVNDRKVKASVLRSWMTTRLNVKDFGAVGDGVADDTAAIVACLNALPAGRTTKARVLLHGTFLVSATITIPSYTVLQLDGILRLKNGSNATVLRVNNGQHIEIVGGEIDGNRANNTVGYGMLVHPGQHIRVCDTFMHDAPEANLRVMGGSSFIEIESNRFVDGGTGNIYLQHATAQQGQPQLYITNVKLRGNTAEYTTYIRPNLTNINLMNARDVIVSENDLSGLCDFGIHTEEHLTNAVISGNLIRGHTQDGIRMAYASYVTITGNNIKDNGQRGISLAQEANNFTIVGNGVNHNGWSGIVLEDCRYGLVSANTVTNNNQSDHPIFNAGIQIYSVGGYAPLYNAVISNVARDDQDVPTQQYGVKEEGYLADYSLIERNDTRGNAIDGVFKSLWGTNHTVTRDNLGQQGILQFAANDATPSVANDIGVYKTANTQATTITAFDNGYVGQTITVFIRDSFTTVDFTGTNLKRDGGVDWTPANGSWLEGVFDGVNWCCTVYSV